MGDVDEMCFMSERCKVESMISASDRDFDVASCPNRSSGTHLA